MSAASLRALLAGSIDYAGLFPPAALSLAEALRNHVHYMQSAEAWMLSTFVLPLSQFDAASTALCELDPAQPLQISALGTKTDDTSDFRKRLSEAVPAINSFRSRHPGVAINQLEMALPRGCDIDLFAHIDATLRDLALQTFWEAPADAAEGIIALLAQHNSNTSDRLLGYKLRSGGVTADAFPTSTQIARVLAAAAERQVPIKFTAGLHHPIRQFRDEVKAKMHGFLNVLGAGVLAAEHGWNEAGTAAMIEDEDAGSFSFNDDSFAWREWKIDTSRIDVRRQLVTSFGSCSFDEPRQDLRALDLL